jgi:hypothetical protein
MSSLRPTVSSTDAVCRDRCTSIRAIQSLATNVQGQAEARAGLSPVGRTGDGSLNEVRSVVGAVRKPPAAAA